MPEYLTPGVYVEEFEIGAKPIEGVSTSTAGFLGLTERGPIDPRPVASFEDFRRLYGGFIEGSYLAYALDGFFRNGGQRCFIGRVAKSGAKKANVTIDPVTFWGNGPGSWGKRVAVNIGAASLNKPELFKLTIAYWEKEIPADLAAGADPAKKLQTLIDSAAIVETFDNLSIIKKSSDYYETKINAASNLVQLKLAGDTRPANTSDPLFIALTVDGDEGVDLTRTEFLGSETPGQESGLKSFEKVDDINIVYVPDIHQLDEANMGQLINDVVAHCETLKDRFAVLEAPQNLPAGTTIGNLRPPTDSKYAAYYYPWVKVFDPITKGPKLVPPGGLVVGIYARSDTERGVHKAPANEVVRGATDLQTKISKGQQGLLNPRGVNVIRAFPGRGIRVWGARTISSDTLWKYINVRRLFIYIEESIEKGTQWVVFEPNNEKLWARVVATITQFLTGVWRDGALMGTKPEEAFFVKCDRSTMTQDDIDNGRLICVIGIAPTKPAEFVIFRIAQWAGGSAATE